MCDRLSARPIELPDANAFVDEHHRHHKPVVSHRFSIAAWLGARVVGVAICGRPVSGSFDKLMVLEVLRCCTDGTRNACSFLYAAVTRAARAIGYRVVQTYLLATERGASLKALRQLGWRPHVEVTRGREWKRTGDYRSTAQGTLFSRSRIDQPTCDKRRWLCELEVAPC